VNIGELLKALLFGLPVPPEMLDADYPLFFQRTGGLLLTFIVTVFSLLFGLLIGTVLSIWRRGAIAEDRTPEGMRFLLGSLRGISVALIEGIRGLPIMLLVLLVFHLPYRLTGLRFPGIILAIAAFSLYAGAYFSEILRAGFRSIPAGLVDAGRVLGLKPYQSLLKIELPLAIRSMMPDVANLAVTIFKDTSTLAVVAVAELTYTGRQLLMSLPMKYGIVLFLMLLLYWAPAGLISAFLAPKSDGGAAWKQTEARHCLAGADEHEGL
jgi:ABC-type amino acid transport system permease subunit